MLRMAAEHGTTDLVCTPHANLTYKFEPEQIATRLAELTQEVDGSIRLYSGCDFHLSYENIQDAIEHPTKYTINHSCYMLVEFSDLLIFRNTGDIFYRLAEAGMIPVITHPERNSLLRQRLEEIRRWVEEGACVQVTAQSLLGEFGRRALDFSRNLLDEGLVHFIASDAHDTQRRPPRLDQACSWLAQNYGAATAEALCIANPRAVLTGERLPGIKEGVAPSKRKWYQFWGN